MKALSYSLPQTSQGFMISLLTARSSLEPDGSRGHGRDRREGDARRLDRRAVAAGRDDDAPVRALLDERDAAVGPRPDSPGAAVGRDRRLGLAVEVSRQD